MNRAGHVALRPLALFANIYQSKFFAAIHAAFHIRDVGLFNARLRLIHQLQELLCVCHRKTPGKLISIHLQLWLN